MSCAPLGPPCEWAESSRQSKLAIRRWEPPQVPKAVVLIVHGGAGWHSGYFDILGQALRAAGYAAVAYDQVGSGYSEGDPGYVERYSFVVDDLQKRAEEEQKRYPKCQVFALGESAGALLCLRHGLGRADAGLPPEPVAGYLLCGPVVRVKKEMIPPPCVVGIFKLLSNWIPRMPLPGVDVISTFDAAFGEPQWAAAGKADPIVRRVLDAKIHVRTGAETLGAVDFVNDATKQKLFTAPFACLVGEKESRVDVGAIFEFYLQAGSKDKYLKVIPNGCHQLFQDKADVTQQAVREVIAWLDGRC
ncbi:Monoglyceride lipase (MGL) (Monoacylglycerol lipase) (MAGL) [Durusdinium trenchii]|uniref:Monoglyceride lipase (MGL) (Monoacylglycerol lipase) (MAGL) n=1 Tax=Durusdinium trenchii TaxID=1381693 RepID=A0ABP0JXQ8_9DINO